MGRAGEACRVGSEWTGWSGRVAHPDAPLGGGGPGFFAEAGGGFGRDGVGHAQDSDLPAPARPGPLGEDGPQAPAAKPRAPNPPPATVARSLGKQKSVHTEFVEVDIEAEVLDDATGGPTNSARTRCVIPAMSAPAYTSEAGKIKTLKGKLTWKGKITIQTRYGAGASASSLSCYGRGTTEADIRAGDVTLGFHESCHQADFVNYLAKHGLPEPPVLALGMPVSDYEQAVNDYRKAVAALDQAIQDDSDARTDDVGHRRSMADRQGCYSHHLP